MNFLIGGWLTISTLVILVGGNQIEWQPSLSNSLFLIEYNETAGNNDSSMLNINNYSIIEYQEGTELRIDSIAIVAEIRDMDYDTLDVTIPSYSTVIALKTERAKYKTLYLITVKNIRNKLGQIQPPDTSYFYFNGYHPNLIEIPETQWNKTN